MVAEQEPSAPILELETSGRCEETQQTVHVATQHMDGQYSLSPSV